MVHDAEMRSAKAAATLPGRPFSTTTTGAAPSSSNDCTQPASRLPSSIRKMINAAWRITT